MPRKPQKLTLAAERERKARNQRDSRAKRAKESVSKLELYVRTELHEPIREYARKLAE